MVAGNKCFSWSGRHSAAAFFLSAGALIVFTDKAMIRSFDHRPDEQSEELV
jgi:hypothetical protein